MNSLTEIENAVDSLPQIEQEKLLRYLADRLRCRSQPKREVPVIPTTGRQITQEEIDDACDAE